MCQFMSFYHNPRTHEVRVYDLTSHEGTAMALGLYDSSYPDGWREGHYLLDGTVECRVLDADSHTSEECVASVRARWPGPADFLAWAVQQDGVLADMMWLDLSYTGVTDVSPLSSLMGLTWLDLSYTGVTDVSPLSSLRGLTWLYLSRTGVTDVSALGPQVKVYR